MYKRLSIMIVFLVALVGCNTDAVGDAVDTTGEEVEQEVVQTIRMASWSQPITEQINLLTEEKDFFADQGLEVEFIPGAGGGDAITAIAANQADIAFTDPGSFFGALSQGEDLVAIYNIYPQNVFNVVSLKDADIQGPEDLKGKKVGVYSLSSGTRHNLLILLKQAGLTEEDVDIIETGVLNFAPLMQGQVDATAATDTGFATGIEKGLEGTNVIEVKDYLNYSSDLFVVTRETYEQDKEMLTRFLTAYRESVLWMMEEPEEAAAHAVEFALDGKDEAHNQTIVQLRNEASMPLSGDLADLGNIDITQLQEAADHYYELELIPNKIQIEDHVVEPVFLDE